MASEKIVRIKELSTWWQALFRSKENDRESRIILTRVGEGLDRAIPMRREMSVMKLEMIGKHAASSDFFHFITDRRGWRMIKEKRERKEKEKIKDVVSESFKHHIKCRDSADEDLEARWE
ncbi:MAG: hypothetical protein ACFFEX_03195 [Candidatus Thorarchaeota archaeon]